MGNTFYFWPNNRIGKYLLFWPNNKIRKYLLFLTQEQWEIPSIFDPIIKWGNNFYFWPNNRIGNNWPHIRFLVKVVFKYIKKITFQNFFWIYLIYHHTFCTDSSLWTYYISWVASTRCPPISLCVCWVASSGQDGGDLHYTSANPDMSMDFRGIFVHFEFPLYIDWNHIL